MPPMAFLDKLKRRLLGASQAELSAAAQLPTQPPPKVKAKQQSLPSLYPNATPSDQAILLRREMNLANSDALLLRRGASTLATIRDFTVASPDLSAALNANLRLGIPDGFRIKAWDPDGTFNVDGTRLAYQLVQRMDLVPDYTEGFSTINSLLATSEALGKDGLCTGAMCLELVLDKGRLPQKLVPIAASQIVFFPDVSGKGVSPTQLLGGVYTSLDLPTFFYVSLDQDLLTAYATSPFESALQAVVNDADFTNDMRRVTKRNVYPRLDITINDDKFKLSASPEILNDPVKLQAYRQSVEDAIAKVVNGLAPEDALVHFDFLVFTYIDGATNAPQDVFKGIQELINAKVSTGAKVMPSILGHGAGSQNIASSETLLALKTADGLIRRKLNELYSKAFTLAVRLFGLDVAVTFEYNPIELRPTSELEAFFAQRQSRILEQLSFGFITDEEAAIDLTGALPPAGMPKLSGTMFSQGISRGGGENPYSNAPAAGGSGSGSGGSASNQATKSKAPTGQRGGTG